MGFVKQKGTVKSYIQSLGLYNMQMDARNTIWVVAKDPLQLITAFMTERGGRVNIGTLSGFVLRIGKLKDGLKNFLLSSGMFEFDQTKDGGSWVTLKTFQKGAVGSQTWIATKPKQEVEEQETTLRTLEGISDVEEGNLDESVEGGNEEGHVEEGLADEGNVEEGPRLEANADGPALGEKAEKFVEFEQNEVQEFDQSDGYSDYEQFDADLKQALELSMSLM